jgi:hypothetical protein
VQARIETAGESSSREIITMLADKFVGTWVSALPFDSEDYLVEYSISLNGETFVVKAMDLQDGEKFRISEVHFDGTSLQFVSYMPSTKRKGVHRFRMKSKNRMEAQFTFTVVEELKRVRHKATILITKGITKSKDRAYVIRRKA